MKLYARREPTTDSATRDMLRVRADAVPRFDVVLYASETATTPVARYPWHYSTKPTRRNKRVTHNCATYDLAWLPDAK